MAAPTITRTPVSVAADNVLSAYEPVMFECSYTILSGATNDRMECAVYHGSSATLLGTMKKESIDIGGGVIRYRFNIADMLKTVLSMEFFNNISADVITSGNEKIATSFYCVFTPKYTDSNGDSQEDSTATSSTYTVGNGIIPSSDSVRVFSTAKKWTLTDTSSEFLTHAPQNLTLYSGEDYQLSFYYVGSNQLELNYQTYDLGGTANAAQTVALKTITNKEGSFTISDNGASTIIDDFTNISKVDVWIEDSAASQLSEKKTFLISQECVDGYRLLWLNSLGGVDKYTFKSYKNLSFNASKRINYTKPLDDTPTTEERATSTINVQGNFVYKGVSEPVTSLTMFKDLISSTNVYLQSGTIMEPVVIRSMEQVLTDTDGLLQVEIEFENSQQEKTHIG